MGETAPDRMQSQTFLLLAFLPKYEEYYGYKLGKF